MVAAVGCNDEDCGRSEFKLVARGLLSAVR